MTISTEKKVWTDEEFMALSKDGHRYELVHGELVDRGSSGMEHSYIACILYQIRFYNPPFQCK
ncbi:MAG: hypothetical protein Fur006_48540 [Coleofasciculaceae cyanobacterium]